MEDRAQRAYPVGPDIQVDCLRTELDCRTPAGDGELLGAGENLYFGIGAELRPQLEKV